MGRRSLNRPDEFDEEDFLSDDDAGSELFTRQRLVAGGLTAFAVAFSYVGANAMWYQPHPHMSAFFETRIITNGRAAAAEEAPEAPSTIVRIEEQPVTDDVPTAGIPGANVPALPPTAPMPGLQPSPAEETAPGYDRSVEQVQRVLAGLDIYAGAIDGLIGPQTRSAIEAYRARAGLAGGAEIDDALLKHLGLAGEGELRMAAAPSDVQVDAAMPAAVPSEPDPRIMRIQAGLKAFGNDAIEIDGNIGPETRAALTEFQSLFGLPVTGKPDTATEAKMREIGLTN